MADLMAPPETGKSFSDVIPALPIDQAGGKRTKETPQIRQQGTGGTLMVTAGGAPTALVLCTQASEVSAMPPAETLMLKMHGTACKGHVLLNMERFGAVRTLNVAPGVLACRTLQALTCQMGNEN